MDYNGNRTCIQRGNYHRMTANCYVTVQTFGDIYPPQKALNVGTVFAALDYPFTSTCCFSKRMKGGAYE